MRPARIIGHFQPIKSIEKLRWGCCASDSICYLTMTKQQARSLSLPHMNQNKRKYSGSSVRDQDSNSSISSRSIERASERKDCCRKKILLDSRDGENGVVIYCLCFSFPSLRSWPLSVLKMKCRNEDRRQPFRSSQTEMSRKHCEVDAIESGTFLIGKSVVHAPLIQSLWNVSRSVVGYWVQY